MFWITVLLEIGGIIALLTAVYVADKKGVLTRNFTMCLVFGILALLGSNKLNYHLGAGKPTLAFWLDEKMIYKVSGQITTTKGEVVVIVENAKGKVRCVKNPEPLPPETHFVKVIDSTPGQGLWQGLVLGPVDSKSDAENR